MKLPKPGIIYYCSYLRRMHDPHPLLFVLYSDRLYTIGLNLHYFSKKDYDRLVKLFTKLTDDQKVSALFKRDKYKFYHTWLKRHFKDVIDECYRTYFTGLLQMIPASALALNGIGMFVMPFQDKAQKNKAHNKLRGMAHKDKSLHLLFREFNVFKTQSATWQAIRKYRDSIRGSKKV